MAITDATAIKFSNEYLRPLANKIARAKFRASETKQQWDALSGGWQDKLNVMPGQLTRAANHLMWAYHHAKRVTGQWDADNLQAVIPDDPAEELWDNNIANPTGPDPKRPPVTGRDLRNINWHGEELVNWLERGVFLKDFGLDLALHPIANVGRDRALRVWRHTVAAVTPGEANNLIATLGELLAEYETDNPSHWGHVLKVAVNPGSDAAAEEGE